MAAVLSGSIEAACQVGVNPSPMPDEPPADLKVSLERDACFGRCPVYKVDLDSDGQVTFLGMEHVKAKGAADWKVPHDTVMKIWMRLREVDFLNFPEELYPGLCKYSSTDSPTVTITVTSSRFKKTVAHYHGWWKCEPRVKGLRQLQDDIDKLLGTRALIK